MKINYTTWLKTQIGCLSEEKVFSSDINSVTKILDLLSSESSKYRLAFEKRNVIYAEVSGKIIGKDVILDQNVEEITLFSPIVGG